MSVADALTAQGMATRHKRSVKAVVQGIGHINALLRRCIKTHKNVKYKSFGKAVNWYVRKLDETAEWNSGQLGTRDFEEKDPIAEAELDMCFLDRTYAVSEKTIKINRAGGDNKIYDQQKENARVAQSAIYRAITTALYSNSDGSVANGPAGLRTICGNPYESTNIALAANLTYGGIANTSTSAISSYAAKKASFTNKYWAPECIGIVEMPHPVSAGDKWSSDCLESIEFMATAMARTKDVSGTGKIVRPDLALMDIDPFNAMWAKHITYKGAGGPINLSDNDFDKVGIKNIIVSGITCVYDENVPTDAAAGGSGYEIVFFIDSSAFNIHTCNTKSEGLVEGQWKGNTDPEISGGVGVYKSNLMFCIDSPVCAGAIVGCHD